MVLVALSLGSNRGDSHLILSNAVLSIKKWLHTRDHFVSSFYLTNPWGKKDQSNFFNLVITFSTILSPENLLKKAQGLEKKHGRDRTKENFWGPRFLDVDIIFYGSDIICTETLKIPHPHMHKRRFVLEPLAEINASWQHPILSKNTKELLEFLL
ncbi:2-amino-4-hydroxy-6-hydroxymethyldihydropteridine diphosphokinase [PVC group bacterium (ex Bugula neritina AB1)]|nr:2-amino-4-hydroxy-6-hydroxymethyldihydropteridine diphosphokinase [PVC group bacterium (ex Bugula neritina AB1)]